MTIQYANPPLVEFKQVDVVETAIMKCNCAYAVRFCNSQQSAHCYCCITSTLNKTLYLFPITKFTSRLQRSILFRSSSLTGIAILILLLCNALENVVSSMVSQSLHLDVQTFYLYTLSAIIMFVVIYQVKV